MLFKPNEADFSLFSGNSAGVPVPLALPRTAEVDAGEEHGQLRRLEFDAIVAGGVGQLEGSGFQPLVPDRQAVTVEVEDLEPIPTAVDEEEKMAGQKVLAKAFLDQPGETVEAFSHVGRSGTEEQTHGRGKLRKH
jgi:hypothetical protein